MFLNNLEQQSFETTPMDFFNSKGVYGKYDSDVLKSNEGDGKELEEQLTHLSSLPVVKQQSPEISKLISIVFEGDTNKMRLL